MDGILHRGTKAEKRKSIVRVDGGKAGKDGAATRSAKSTKPVHFEIIWESPPLVMLLNAQNSSGALMSERIKLHVDDPAGAVTLTSWTATLRLARKTKRPIGKDCAACSTILEDLKTARIITKPTTYHADRDNQVPFSYHFEGHLPATTDCQLGAIAYELVVEATTAAGEHVRHIEPVRLQRALPEGTPKLSIRIFPPTNLTSRVQLPPVVHPIGTFPVQLTLSGVVDTVNSPNTRWRMRKLSWRVEEQCRMVSSPCPTHVHKIAEGKAIQYSEVRTLGNDDLKGGWKSDFDTAGGEIHCEFDASVATKASHQAVCDVDATSAAAGGLAVSHNLVIELVVAEEILPGKGTQTVTPTGAARVLRMQFALVVTERAGMGIAWDEEQPPMYEDVPASPPGYGSADRNDGAWGGAEMLEYQYEGDPLAQTYLDQTRRSIASLDLDSTSSHSNSHSSHSNSHSSHSNSHSSHSNSHSNSNSNNTSNEPPTYEQGQAAQAGADLVIDNSGLPMRTARDRFAASAPPARPSSSGRAAGWTWAELEEEPRHVRRRSSSGSNDENDDTQGPGEGRADYAEGTSKAAAAAAAST